jgi:hypothetical protein
MWTCPKCREEVDAGFEVCWQCGTTPGGMENPDFVREVDAALDATPARPRPLITSPNPVCRVCPQCGRDEYRRVKADTRIAFTDDRICRACGCRYTPPTPVWASLVLLILGMVLSLGSLASFLILGLRGEVPGVIGNGLGLAVGLLCVAYGWRSLWHAKNAGPRGAD